MDKPITTQTTNDWQLALNSAPEIKKNVNLSEDTIEFNSWKKSIIDALTFLDNDYDLGMPGGEKEKQIFKDDLITKVINCPNYKCVSKYIKHTFDNHEIIKNIMDSAYEKYNGNMKNTNDETTTASSSGSFEVPLMGGTPKFQSNVVIKKKDIGNLVQETTATSSGSYEQPQIWAKNRDNWRGKIKTYKGGKFVHIKEKCKKFPYCNESPGAIELSDVPLDKLDKVFEALSKKTNKPYNVIKGMFFKHFDVK